MKKLWDFIRQNSWETIHFTHEIEAYSRMKGILNNNHIPSKTKSRTPPYQIDGLGTTYEILVKKKDLYRARQAIIGTDIN